MYEKKYKFRLNGTTPLILHWDNLEWADQMDAERTAIKESKNGEFKAGDDRCPAHTWKGYMYNDGTHVALPHDNFGACLLKAGARIVLDKQKTFKELTQCGLLFDSMYMPILVGGKPIAWSHVEGIGGAFSRQAIEAQALGFVLFVKRAKIGQAKHVRVRPRFNQWSIEGSLTVIKEEITQDILGRLFQIAGLYIGLCDWRPGSPKSPGPYGQFSAEITEAKK